MPSTTENIFRLDFKVRDYECDIQGIVNNSVYLNYLEHARHEFLLSKGISFSELANKGINLVVTKAELNYKAPLRSGDAFCVELLAKRSSKIRGMFEQKIIQKKESKTMVEAVITWASINHQGRPIHAQELDIFL